MPDDATSPRAHLVARTLLILFVLGWLYVYLRWPWYLAD